MFTVGSRRVSSLLCDWFVFSVFLKLSVQSLYDFNLTLIVLYRLYLPDIILQVKKFANDCIEQRLQTFRVHL